MAERRADNWIRMKEYHGWAVPCKPVFTKDNISYFGGIYLENKAHKYFSIITTSSRDNIAHIHKRNPLIIAKNKIIRWFSTEYDEFLFNKDVELNFEGS